MNFDHLTSELVEKQTVRYDEMSVINFERVSNLKSVEMDSSWVFQKQGYYILLRPDSSSFLFYQYC